jgi:hypothetical protein
MTIVAAVIVCSVVLAAPTRATVLGGCVAPAEAGVTHLVGWVDVGVMLGTAEPEPPSSLLVTAPDGRVIDYRNGAGLVPPTDVLPIWFAPAEIEGDYELLVDGYEACTIKVGDESVDLTPVADKIDGDWVPHSAPITRS